jgi:hypothetical protein
MAWNEAIRSITLEADSSIGIYTGPPGQPGSAAPNGGKLHYFVRVTGARTAGLANATTTKHRVLGVLQGKPQAVGAAAEVAIRGVSLVVTGTGGLAAGDAVKVDANGAGVAATVGTDADNLIVGTCLVAAAAGGLASVLLKLN